MFGRMFLYFFKHVSRIQEGQALRRELGTKVNQDAFQQMNGDAGSRLAEMEGKLAQVCFDGCGQSVEGHITVAAFVGCSGCIPSHGA